MLAAVVEEPMTVVLLPLAVLAASLETNAVMSLSVGLVLDSITHQEKMRFEKDLLAASQPRSPA